MKLFEFQAKELLAKSGVRTPPCMMIEKKSQVMEAVASVGLPCVLKAQVLRGGRGKAGLIRFAATLDEAESIAEALLSSGTHVQSILLEEALDIEIELFLSIAHDPVSGSHLILASSAGGMDIEEVASIAPVRLIQERVDPLRGLQPYQARYIAYQLGIDNELAGEMTRTIMNVHDLFVRIDAELVEINPLIITRKHEMIAADGKISIDEGALYRHKEFSLTRSHFDSDLEYEAANSGFPFLGFDGDIGIMCAGAGLTNAVFDMIHFFGGKPAFYLEFGGPNYTRAVEAMRIALKGLPKVLLIVTFGTIARADVMARGIEEAIGMLKPDIPIITAIRGTGEEEANEILERIGLHPLADTQEAVELAINLARTGVGK